MRYRFDGFIFDPESGLWRAGEAVPLEPQALALLHHLLKHHDRVVSREELNERLWGGRIVSEAALSTQIRTVRRALGDDRLRQAFIRTHPKRGFRFVAPIEIDDGEIDDGEIAPIEIDDGEAAPAAAPAPRRPPRRRLAVMAVGAAALGLLVLGGLGSLGGLGGFDLFAARHPSPASVAEAPELSIAVLPFDLLAGDESKRYLADAFTEDLITDLSRIRDAFVISRSTTFTYRGRTVDAATVARELGVRYVLEGSLRIEGEEVRINAQLIDGGTRRHLWADRYEQKLAELFDLQDNVTGRIASVLRAELRMADDRRQTPEATDDAWGLALKGNVILYNHESIADYRKAHALLSEAVARDPSIASAWAGLAFVHYVASFADIPGVSRPDSATLSFEAARKAVEADPMNAEPYWLLGAGYARHGQPERGMAACRTAMDLNPNMDCGHVCAGLVHMAMGEPEKAVPLFEYALRLNPRFRPFTKEKYLGLAHLQSGNSEAAIAALNRALAKAPEDAFAHLVLAAALALDGRDGEARATLNRYREETAGALPTIAALGERIGWLGPETTMARLFEGLRTAGLAES